MRIVRLNEADIPRVIDRLRNQDGVFTEDDLLRAERVLHELCDPESDLARSVRVG